MSGEKNEWPGRLYVWVSLLIRLLHGGKWEGTLGVLLLSIHWGENWSMRVSDVGFNVQREREVHLYSCSTDGLCWSDVLSPSAGQPVRSCLCMCPGTVGTTNCSLARPDIKCLGASNKKPRFPLVLFYSPSKSWMPLSDFLRCVPLPLSLNHCWQSQQVHILSIYHMSVKIRGLSPRLIGQFNSPFKMNVDAASEGGPTSARCSH